MARLHSWSSVLSHTRLATLPVYSMVHPLDGDGAWTVLGQDKAFGWPVFAGTYHVCHQMDAENYPRLVWVTAKSSA